MKKLSVFVLGLALTFGATAQDYTADNGFNPQSTKGIHRSDIMWRKTVWRALDLREKQNEPLFSNGNELTLLLIDAVKEGIIQPWKSDSLDAGQPLSVEEFLKNMELPVTVVEDEGFGFSDDGGWGDDPFAEEGDGDAAAEPAVAAAKYYFAKDLYQMQIKEDLIFDKQRSVMYYDILAVTMLIPADHPDNIKGIEMPIASFSYKELTEKLFADNPKAIWYNRQNDNEHLNLSDAFELRLFSSYIIKVSNPNNEYLVDTYGGDPWTGLVASQWKAFELLEFEHNLWEF